MNTASLQAQVQGHVLAPADPDYEQARLPWNLVTDQRPALIVLPQSVDDVIAAVRFANQSGLGVAVQNTGHGLQGAADDGLLIVMSQLKAVEVDSDEG